MVVAGKIAEYSPLLDSETAIVTKAGMVFKILTFLLSASIQVAQALQR
jgi:hypothetical protein